MSSCGHASSRVAGICRACGESYCRSCGSPQVVTVEKHEFKDWPGGYSEHIRHVKEMWPLCHACAAKMPPVWVEPTPPPPLPITSNMNVSSETSGFDLSRAMELLEVLGIAKEPAKGKAHEWGTYGVSPVQTLLKQEQAKQVKPPKPKKTPQSVLEADVERFLRECDDD